MTRWTNSAIETALDQEHVPYAVAAELDFVSGMVRAHLGAGELIVNGVTFYGVGTVGNGGLGAISEISERPDGRDYTQLRLAVSGVDPSLLALIPDRNEWYMQDASVYFLPLDPETMLPITPTEPAIFSGFMANMSRERKRGVASVQMTVKHYDAMFAEASQLLYTQEHQVALGFTTDTLLLLVPETIDKEITWGGRTLSTGGGGGGGAKNPRYYKP